MRLLFTISLILGVSGCAIQRAIPSSDFYPLLHCAADSGDEYCVQILLKCGADPNGSRDYEEAQKIRGYGTEPMSHLFTACYAGHLKIVKLLTNAGADINAREGEGQTPLWGACAQNHLEIVEFLVSRGARQDLKGENLTPLEIARKRGYVEIVKFLQRKTSLGQEPSPTRKISSKDFQPNRSVHTTNQSAS